MPTFCYMLIPLLGAVLAFVIARRWLKHGAAKKEDEFGHPCSLVLAVGVFFLTEFALLAFAPAPGSGGPVQYAAGNDAALELFHWRMRLFWISLVGLPVTFISSLSTLTIALMKGLNRHAVVSMLAWAAVVGSGWFAISYSSWIPTV